MSSGYRMLVLSAVFVAVFVLGVIVTGTAPTKDNIFGEVVFFVSIFTIIMGICVLSLSSLYCRNKNNTDGHCLSRATRHGILITLVITISLILQWFGLLFWWSALLAAATVLLLELYIILVRRAF